MLEGYAPTVGTHKPRKKENPKRAKLQLDSKAKYTHVDAHTHTTLFVVENGLIIPVERGSPEGGISSGGIPRRNLIEAGVGGSK